METIEKTNDVITDLIQINNDRVVGYDKASQETASGDADLRALFHDMAEESRGYGKELGAYALTPAEGTSLKGKIYRIWSELKVTFSGNTRKSILEACEHTEDATQKSYDEALSSDAEISAELRQIIMKQKTNLKKSHDRIKKLRDAQPA